MSRGLVLVDTSVWVLALRKTYIPVVKEKVERLLDEEYAAITPMITLELLGGTSSPKEFDRLRQRLEVLPQIPIDEVVWGEAARIEFNLRRHGLTVPYTDVLISSAALRSNVSLLHADKHYDLISDKTSLIVESLVSIV